MKLLVFTNVSCTHLLPVFSAKPLNYLLGGLALVNSFLPVATLLIIYPLYNKPQKLSAVTFWTAATATIIFVIGVLGSIGTFGADFIVQLNWPILAAIRWINIPDLVLEQVGLIFLVVWITMFIVA